MTRKKKGQSEKKDARGRIHQKEDASELIGIRTAIYEHAEVAAA